MIIRDNSTDSTENLSKKLTALEQEVQVLKQQNAEMDAKIKWYEEQYRLSAQRQFGSSSEKTMPEQISLFNETEDSADPGKAEPTLESVTYQRKKRQPGDVAEKSRICLLKSSNINCLSPRQSVRTVRVSSMK